MTSSASSSSSFNPAAANPNLQLPPLRSLDDFLLGSARFQLPNLRDLEKWGNRVVKNLLYYQTNYLLCFIAVYVLMALLYPAKIFCGILVKALLIVVLVKFFPERSTYNRWYYLGGSLFVGYVLLLWYDALLLSAFTLLLPFAVTFVHSSLRLRNIRNKGFNVLETFTPSTPMGMFLDAMNITVENILN
ncbi:unnamed protein product [Hermetia illucens]|uniref:PRA1 family protein n=1 Tax=Hermetia illucens TaxID=343691 RepID=A0A7R8V6T6_HERIL|nr:PRA1 family protein 2 [Hermetia illucens]CAD7093923.1 unnamed protein product [Hermetia illucens]